MMDLELRDCLRELTEKEAENAVLRRALISACSDLRLLSEHFKTIPELVAEYIAKAKMIAPHARQEIGAERQGKPPDATPEEEGLVVCPLAGICLDREDCPEHGKPHAKKPECNIAECGAAERIIVGPCVPAQAEKGGEE
jgi:hypothetical protein